ncbi:patatin-like phospholipase family protein [Candidatus Parcubacteria bacterium]|nr:patatin-like phospholipase family protein [Candidatus Parcubacteria bacterium]
MQHKKKLKIGLALGSGGVKGLAHIGVIKVLEKNNIPIDFIAGSSIGALVGTYYAIYKDVDKLEKVALSSNWRTALSLLDPTWNGGLVKGAKVEDLIKGWFNGYGFDDLKIPLTIVVTDLISGQEVDIASGDLAKAVRASLSVPPIFKPIKYNGYLLADGGLSNPLPDDIVRKMGADIVIAVNLDNKNFDDSLNEDSLSISKTSIRALNIIRYHFAQNCSRNGDVVIKPKIKEIGLVGWNKFFNEQGAEEIIKAGGKAAIKSLVQIKNFMKEKEKEVKIC